MTESKDSTEDPESTKSTDNFLSRVLHYVGELGDEILRFLLLMTLILTVCGPTLALTFGPSLALVFVGVVLVFTFVVIALDRAYTDRSSA